MTDHQIRVADCGYLDYLDARNAALQRLWKENPRSRKSDKLRAEVSTEILLAWQSYQELLDSVGLVATLDGYKEKR